MCLPLKEAIRLSRRFGFFFLTFFVRHCSSCRTPGVEPIVDVANTSSGRDGGCAHVCPSPTRRDPQLPQRHGLAADTALTASGPSQVRALGPVRRSRSRCWRPPAISGGRSRRSSPASIAPEPRFPIAYPTAARPQAWAAGTPILLLRLLLGLEPDVTRGTLGTLAEPARSGHGHLLEGVPALGRTWDVSCGAGASSIELAA